MDILPALIIGGIVLAGSIAESRQKKRKEKLNRMRQEAARIAQEQVNQGPREGRRDPSHELGADSESDNPLAKLFSQLQDSGIFEASSQHQEDSSPSFAEVFSAFSSQNASQAVEHSTSRDFVSVEQQQEVNRREDAMRPEQEGLYVASHDGLPEEGVKSTEAPIAMSYDYTEIVPEDESIDFDMRQAVIYSSILNRWQPKCRGLRSSSL